MLANRHNEVVQNILTMFEDAGYDVSLTLANAKDKALQKKEREFFILDSVKI